jgi:hypothetical protein
MQKWPVKRLIKHYEPEMEKRIVEFKESDGRTETPQSGADYQDSVQMLIVDKIIIHLLVCFMDFSNVSNMSTNTIDVFRDKMEENVEIIINKCCFVIKKLQSFGLAEKIGIIGYGNVGSQLLERLIKEMNEGNISASIIVSTCQPDDLLIPNKFGPQSKNIHAIFDNEFVFNNCDITILCVPPIRSVLIAKSINSVRSSRLSDLVILSLLRGINEKKTKDLFGRMALRITCGSKEKSLTKDDESLHDFLTQVQTFYKNKVKINQ